VQCIQQEVNREINIYDREEPGKPFHIVNVDGNNKFSTLVCYGKPTMCINRMHKRSFSILFLRTGYYFVRHS